MDVLFDFLNNKTISLSLYHHNVVNENYCNRIIEMRLLTPTRLCIIAIAAFLLLLYGFGNAGCKSERDYSGIPYIYTDTTIDVSSAMYHNLEFIGGWGYIPSGFKGIFLYHVTENQFIALERCCTYDPEIFEARVYYDEKGGVLRDSVCGSEFHPFLDGNVTQGPAELPLRKYKTQYYESGALKRLRIYN